MDYDEEHLKQLDEKREARCHNWERRVRINEYRQRYKKRMGTLFWIILPYLALVTLFFLWVGFIDHVSEFLRRPVSIFDVQTRTRQCREETSRGCLP